ncbi:hypothetical protein K0M31_014302 [Melipona bicolor]|uniref:Uncharacterized protein n=1 Tax=Melipona bicolor TaxID=60889 RepID=A0AA40G8B3_9HYME|nr:hypothetical protein K0M31_014302 [Melipona bicolor]
MEGVGGKKHARKRETGERYRRRKTLIGGEKTEKGRQPNGQSGTRKKAAVEEGRVDEDSRRMELWKQKQKPVSLAQGCLPESVSGPGAEATESSRATATWSAVSIVRDNPPERESHTYAYTGCEQHADGGRRRWD